MVSVPDEAQGRWFGVAAREQPGHVGDSGAEYSTGFGAEPDRVLRSGASMLARVGHAVARKGTAEDHPFRWTSTNCSTVRRSNSSPPNVMPSSRIFRVSIWFFGPRFKSDMALG